MTASKPMFVEITPSLVLPILNQRPTDPSSSSFTVEAQSNEIKPTYPNSHSAQGDTLADESFFLYDTTLNFVDDRTKSLSGADMHYDGPTRTLSLLMTARGTMSVWTWLRVRKERGRLGS